MNFINSCGAVLGVCVVVSLGMSATSITENMRRGATASADKQGAIQSSTELLQEKRDHAKNLADLLKKPETVIMLTKQISGSATKNKLRTMRSIVKPGSKITVGGSTGLTPAAGILVVDEVGTIAMVDEEGLAVNPWNPKAKHLPQMTPDQIKSFRKFQNGDLYSTPPEQLERPKPEANLEQDQQVQ
ncbi:MAG: hypothetical protein ACRC62_31665 [Microcoleus sp.]